MATIIAIAQSIRNDRRRSPIRLAELQQVGESQVPGLAVVIVGVRKDSQSYESMKRKACAEVGIRSIDVDFPEQISELDVVAKLAVKGREPLFQPCTPKVCLELLTCNGISIEGKRAVVVVLSNMHTHDSDSIIREADNVIAAAGQAKMINCMVKRSIDVGTNADDDPSRRSGVGPMTIAMLLKNTLDDAKCKITQ
ncbi:hypothetical protein OPV22_012309 [Ensete ventricosum]|uniref:Tetrahydrofolate dehydrogenase/cyclohydrolase catalytic domain-containing protein n=1 Tax=Ensete ventricosum TaxID=4639 RepID=A0AAV8R4L8_ENSVE|nr:hypothetical protein OPV22_012309 [Ensete ventricosum]